MAGIGHLLRELRRRRVFRATGIYIVGAWVAVQVASLVFPAVDIPDEAIRFVWLAVILLFPIVVVFAWFFEVDTDGIRRTPPADAVADADLALRRTDYIIITALAFVAVSITWRLTVDIRDIRQNPRVEFDAGQAHPNSIAVLPLENQSGDPEQQYFVSGMQDALISGLSRIRDLRVTSKTSTMRYADAGMGLPAIAAQLGVSKLIEGSIYRVDDRVRISIQLIDGAEDRHLWSQTFEEDIRDVLRLQQEIAQAIATEVEVAVTPVNAGQDVVPTVNPAAYEAFLKGQFHVERFTPQDMMLAAQYYQQAVALDPNYALAHYGLSKLCAFQAQAGVITPEQARATCWPPIEKALELDPNLPEAYMGYAGHMTWQRFDWAEGAKGFEQAIELNPSYAEARMFYSHYLALVGRTDESTGQMALALELDPFNPFVRGLYGAQLFMIDDYQGCVDVIEGVMATTPGFGFGHNVLWKCYWQLGQKEQSLRSAANYFRNTQGDPTGAIALETAIEEGGFDYAVRHTANLMLEHSKTAHVSPLSIGVLFEQAGDVERAIDMYERAVAQGDPDAPYMAVLTMTTEVHRHPRFLQLLRDMKHDYWAERYAKL